MDIITAIGMFARLLSIITSLTRNAENAPKGRNDQPSEDVIIVDSGEVGQSFRAAENDGGLTLLYHSLRSRRPSQPPLKRKRCLPMLSSKSRPLSGLSRHPYQ